MRTPAPLLAFVSLVACLLASALPIRAAQTDVVLQAGHQGRPASCAPLHVKKCNLGAGSPLGTERDWTPIVADAAARRLRADGFSVVRRPADYAAHDRARFAAFLHFDGAVPACASGASAGFPLGTSPALAERWRAFYAPRFPFAFRGLNITTNESGYYGFRKVDAPEKLLIEFGELSCPAQAAWMKPRLDALGVLLARFIERDLAR
jgi:hypothetical protein